MTAGGDDGRKEQRAALRRREPSSAYDAFLSYSRADTELAGRLQHALERFAKPWNRVRSLKVFRDTTSLAPEAGLWQSIERALEASAHLIVLVSPESAGSRWVGREIAWWREHRSVDRLLLVLTAGELVWDEHGGAWDGERATALPSALAGAHTDEPSWVDARWSRGAPLDATRLEEVTASLAAAIKRVPKDELLAIAVQEHRRTIRLARAGVVSLTVLLIAAVAAGVVALRQRDSARAQERLAVSRQLAALSGSELATNLQASLLLAAQAVERDDNPQSRSALLRAALASPQLVRHVRLPAKVTAIAGSGGGQAVVAGLEDGRVLHWAPEGTPRAIAKLPRAVTDVALDWSGRSVVATDGDPPAEAAAAVLVRDGTRSQSLQVPQGQVASAVGITPDGRRVLVRSAPPVLGGAASISVFDGRTGDRLAVHDATPVGFVVDLAVPSDDEVVVFDGAHGSWHRLDLSSGRLIDHGGVGFGTRQALGTISADGESVTATNGAPEIPVWPTRGSPVNDRPPKVADAPISTPEALALSPDGRRLAVADTGVIYVAATRSPEAEPSTATVLEGTGKVDRTRFLGGSGRLVSVTGDVVVLWDLRRHDRLARSMRVPIRSACFACTGASIAVSPGGTQAAVTSGGGGSAALVDLRRGTSVALPEPGLGPTYLPPMWAARPVRPVLPVSDAEPLSGLPDGVVAWGRPEGLGERVVIAASIAADRGVLVDDRGTVVVVGLRDGRVLRSTTARPAGGPGDASLEAAAVSPQGEVATLIDDRIQVTDAGSGRPVGRVQVPDAMHLAFGGRRLFVQLQDGTLQVRAGAAASLERTLPGDPSYVWPPVPNPQGTIVARQRRNGEIVLVDVTSGVALAAVPRNAGADAAKVGVAFTPDGRQLITVTDETSYRAGATLLLRDLSRAGLLTSVCRAAGFELSQAQWTRLAGGPVPTTSVCS